MAWTFILAHGFAFSDDYWHLLKNLLPGEVLFYQKNMATDSDANYVGVAHSLGFLRLNNSGIRFKYLFGLQGFLDFCGKTERLRRIRMQILDRMIRSFSKNYEEGLREFYARCSYTGETPLHLSKEALLDDLESLKKAYPHCGVSTMIIASEDDPIVPRRVVEDNFLALPQVEIKFTENCRHTMGHCHPELIADIIRERLEH